MTNVSQDDFTAYWAKMVSAEFGLDQADVYSCYESGDKYNTDGNTRALWKYATARGVNGTPMAFVNGVKLDSVPMTVDGWMDLLNSVYNSKYGVASQVEKYLQN